MILTLIGTLDFDRHLEISKDFAFFDFCCLGVIQALELKMFRGILNRAWISFVFCARLVAIARTMHYWNQIPLKYGMHAQLNCQARHTSHVTRHTSHVTRHTSHLICRFLQAQMPVVFMDGKKWTGVPLPITKGKVLEKLPPAHECKQYIRLHLDLAAVLFQFPHTSGVPLLDVTTVTDTGTVAVPVYSQIGSELSNWPTVLVEGESCCQISQRKLGY